MRAVSRIDWRAAELSRQISFALELKLAGKNLDLLDLSLSLHSWPPRTIATRQLFSACDLL